MIVSNPPSDRPLYWKYPPITGSYRIRCLPEGIDFRGISVRIYARWRQEIALLSVGHHADQRLQSLWNGYGPEAFEWSIHRLLPTEVVDEQYRVDVRQLLLALLHKDLHGAFSINEPERLHAYAKRHGTFWVNYFADNSTYQNYHYGYMREVLKMPSGTIKGRLAGVYSFERTDPREIYIGESADIGGRWREHIQGFLDGTHHNLQASAAWKATDPRLWTFRILEVCSENRLAREADWIGRFRSKGNYTLLNHA